MESQKTFENKSYLPCLDLHINNADEKKCEIKQAFNESFTLYEQLFELIEDEGMFLTADPLRHPLIFYLGHTAAFYINKLISARVLKNKERIDSDIESLVAIGVDEMTWDSLIPSREWPSVQEMKTFRNQVRTVVNEVIDNRLTLLDNTEINWTHPMWTIIMGIEHEKIHLETSTCLIRQLPLGFIKKNIPENSIFKRECKTWSNSHSSENNYVDIPGGKISLGRPLPLDNRSQDPKYGWDNEFGLHESSVDNFKVNEKLISNSEFFKFMNDGGYEKQEYWSEEGWNWANGSKARHPKFWKNLGQDEQTPQYVLRLMISETETMPWDWPAEVNCLEASAYCRWLTKTTGVATRLPTEDEYYQVLKIAGYQDDRHITNKALQFSSPTPVGMFKVNNIYDVMGNVWQWTRTPIYPFQKFEPHPIYDDFTLPTYDNKHNLFKGGSWISTGNLATTQSRYAFRRHFFQYAGFRTIQPKDQEYWLIEKNLMTEYDEKNICLTQDVSLLNPYESDPLVNMYCNFDYGERINFFGNKFPQFPVTCALLCKQILKHSVHYQQKQAGQPIILKALDIGCAVGRTTFELSRWFDYSLGLDYSARFIQVASMLQTQEQVPYKVAFEGEIFNYKFATIKEQEDIEVENQFLSQIFNCTNDNPSLDKIRKGEEHIKFVQRDACNLPSGLGEYHVAVAANLVDRLPDPEKFLTDIAKHIVPEGFLILLSPYTWLQEYTPKEKWLGGKQVNAENVYTLHTIEEVLSPWFEPFHIVNEGSGYDDPLHGYMAPGEKRQALTIPFVLAETRRKNQFTFSECSVWKRKKADD